LNLPLAGGGSTTLRRRDRRRGINPDECFWIATEAQVRGRTQIDLRVDPPPDLVIEVDPADRSRFHLGIYAALGVPEVWRFAGESLGFHLLDGKRYRPSPTSPTFPRVTTSDLLGHVAFHRQMDDTTLFRRFRAWLRERLAGGGGAAPAP
jgi:Uma2 family endonuclease